MKSKIKIIALTIFVLGIGFLIARAATWEFNGFSWIGSNLQNGVEQGDPVIGMIAMKGDNYSVNIIGDGDQRPVVGSAWMGIGSTDDKFNDFTNQNDLPSLGWINFNQPFDQDKLDSLISNNCFGVGDCYGARWNKKPGSSNEFEGYLSGWAKMQVGSNGDETPYPDIWVHFKSPGNPSNYTCNEGDHTYYVCVDGQGKLNGYAWSAGADSATIEGNPGLGWISFNKKNIGLGVVAAQSKFCAVLDDNEEATVQKCKSASNFTGQFKFKAYQSGINLNSFNPANNYQWICKSGEAPKTGPNVTCNYPDSGTFTPKLKIYDEASQEWVTCSNQASIEITTNSSCKVLVKKANTSDTNEYSKNVNISQDDNAEGKIDRKCLDGGTVSWTTNGGSLLSQDGDIATFKPTGGTTARISAQIQKDGKTYNCSAATINVKETIRWR